MKRWLSLLLALTLLAGLAASAGADPSFDPVDIPYGDGTYHVTVDGYVVGAENDVTVSISVPKEQQLIRFINGGVEMGMEPLEGAALAVNDDSTPFFTAVQVQLEVDRQLVPCTYAEATLENVMFYFNALGTPTAICLYPYGGSPDTYVRLALPEDASPQAAAPVVDEVEPGSMRFTVGGVTYDVYDLQDVPEKPLANLLDSREGHVVRFSYESSDISDAANRLLFTHTRLITPSGEEVRTYGNDGNSQNPYTLYFGLPDDVNLADCVMRVPADGGDVLIPLSGGVGEQLATSSVPPAQTDETTQADRPAEPDVSAEVPAGQPDLSSLMATFAEEATDPWQKAIYQAGAQWEAYDDDNNAIFYLRSFNPRYSDLGNYPGEDPLGWWDNLCGYVGDYDLEVTLALTEENEPSEDGVKALQRAVRNAAEAARAEFDRKAMRLSIVDQTFPQAFDKQVTGAMLYEENADYSALYENMAVRELPYGYFEQMKYVPLFYAQVSQTLNVKDGPQALVLNCKGVADPDKMLQDAYAAALDTLSRIYKANEKDSDEIEEAFLDALIDQANAIRKKGGESFSLIIDADAMFHDGDFGEDYTAYLEAYAYDEYLDALVDAVWELPDAPAQDFPANGYLSGSRNGTEVIVKAPDDGLGRYIQMRDAQTDEVKVSMFLHPGRRVTVYVPKGMYYFMIASGETWYGVEGMFGENGRYSRTDETEILGSNYYHTIELQTSDDGNMPTYGADMSDFLD